MLVRAARRKARPSAQLPKIAPSTDLYLPWLCPALRNQRVQSRWNSEDANHHGLGFRKRRNSRDGMVFHPRRSLATQMTAERFDPDASIPFDFEMNPGIRNPLQSPSSMYKERPRLEVSDFLLVPPFDATTTLQESDSLIMAPKKHRSYDGIGGDVSEMLSVLQGCLCVGRLKRAQAIIKRLGKIDDVSPQDLMMIHEQYVRAAAERIVANPNDSDTQDLHKWFELQIRGKYDFDYAVLAWMLKASLRESSTKKRDRLVHRYMDLLPPTMTKEEQNDYKILNEKEQELIHSIIEGGQLKVNLDETREYEEEGEAVPAAIGEGKFSAPEEDIAEVRATDQKGLGLSTLKKTLSIFSAAGPGFDPSVLTYEQQKERQTQIEETAVRSAIDRWREENAKMTKMGMNTALQTKNLGARMWKWQLALEDYITTELKKMDELEESGARGGSLEERLNLTVWLRFLPAEQLAAVTILTTMNKLSVQGMDKGMPLSGLIMHLGRSVEEESMASRIFKAARANPTIENKRQEGFLIRAIKRSRKPRMSLAQESQSVTEAQSKSSAKSSLLDDITKNPWTLTTAAQVGAFLITGLIKTAMIPVTRVNPKTEELMTQIQPGFSHSQQYRLGKKIGVVMVNSTLVEQLKREPVHSLLARHLPMVVEPEPWTKFNSGGFITSPVKVVRIKQGDKDQRHYTEAAIGRGDMQQVFKGLDVLGKTAWQVNKPVLHTMLEAWNMGEEIANIPPADPVFNPIPKPAADADPLERKQYLKDIKLQENLKGALHSQRCFQNFQIEIARALRNEIFYFPHNLDFRGRAYPIPPLLNHMGADHCRGLLKFGEAKELGESGLKWLKIHLANVYGYDKASLSEREAFADEHRDEIYDSATNPLGGKRWWLNSEDAWQTLAACVELKNALDCPDPTKFMSSLPVHQDGTCNGLQHYAALGGDEWGAKQVNLEPGDRPSDVYTAVADLVKQGIAEDLAVGNPYAKALNGKINRKIVKQTVMTNVYGVTFIGAKAQVRKALVAAHKDLPNEPNFHPGIFASYIATKIFKSLSTMFRGAHDIQHWLGECANRISTTLTPSQLGRLMEEYNNHKEVPKGSKYNNFDPEGLLQFKSGVVWTTPLHMPVVQPYRVTKSRIVKTNLQQISLSEPHRSDPVSKRKQLQGFPPNFVHSLDATHMILSALKCYDMGLSFAAVHDSFWTHASDIEKMNNVLRDAFIRVHSEDVIGRLASEFDVRYKGSYYMVTIKPGSPIISKLSTLRRSKAYREMRAELLGGFRISSTADKRAEELIIELKVAEMLRSPDPAVVKKAQEWQTPGSLLRESAAQDDFEVPDELVEMGVGKIPTRDAKLKADQSLEVGDMENVDPVEEHDLGVPNEPEGETADEDLAKSASGFAKLPYTFPTMEERFAEKLGGRLKERPKSNSNMSTFAWMPLTFPPVPKRGTFNVERLKDSQYFFS